MHFKGIILILSQFNCILLLTLLCCEFGNAKNHAYLGVNFVVLKFWWCKENYILQVWWQEYTLIWWSPIWCHFKDIKSYPRLLSKRQKVQHILTVNFFWLCAKYIVWADWKSCQAAVLMNCDWLHVRTYSQKLELRLKYLHG